MGLVWFWGVKMVNTMQGKLEQLSTKNKSIQEKKITNIHFFFLFKVPTHSKYIRHTYFTKTVYYAYYCYVIYPPKHERKAVEGRGCQVFVAAIPLE